jgi:ABC-2 type transport system permease protein
MAQILAIAYKDFLRSVRSLFALGMMVVAPLLITGLISLAFGGLASGSGDMAAMRVLVLNADQPAPQQYKFGEMVLPFLQDEKMPGWLQAEAATDESAARRALDDRQAAALVLIPADFSSKILAGEPTSLTILQDPTLTIGPAVLEDLLHIFTGGIAGAQVGLTVIQNQLSSAGAQADSNIIQTAALGYSQWFTALQQNLNHGTDPQLQLVSPLGAEHDNSVNVFEQIIAQVMAGMLIFFTFFTGASSAQLLLKEQEEGTLARLFTTPGGRDAILAGKLLSGIVTVLAQSAVLMGASSLLFGVRWGSPVSVLLAVLSTAFAATGFGLLALSGVRSMRQSGPVIGGVISATGMIGGLMTTAVPMPDLFSRINLLVPQGWALRTWKLTLQGASSTDVLVSALVLALLGAACFAASSIIFRKRFA